MNTSCLRQKYPLRASNFGQDDQVKFKPIKAGTVYPNTACLSKKIREKISPGCDKRLEVECGLDLARGFGFELHLFAFDLDGVSNRLAIELGAQLRRAVGDQRLELLEG